MICSGDMLKIKTGNLVVKAIGAIKVVGNENTFEAEVINPDFSLNVGDIDWFFERDFLNLTGAQKPVTTSNNPFVPLSPPSSPLSPLSHPSCNNKCVDCNQVAKKPEDKYVVNKNANEALCHCSLLQGRGHDMGCRYIEAKYGSWKRYEDCLERR